MTTTIVQVMHKTGFPAFDAPEHPRSTLFQVVGGPHNGMRGADSVLFDTVGPIAWDTFYVSVFETGALLSRAEFEEQTANGGCCPECNSRFIYPLYQGKERDAKGRWGCGNCGAAFQPPQSEGRQA